MSRHESAVDERLAKTIKLAMTASLPDAKGRPVSVTVTELADDGYNGVFLTVSADDFTKLFDPKHPMEQDRGYGERFSSTKMHVCDIPHKEGEKRGYYDREESWRVWVQVKLPKGPDQPCNVCRNHFYSDELEHVKEEAAKAIGLSADDAKWGANLCPDCKAHADAGDVIGEVVKEAKGSAKLNHVVWIYVVEPTSDEDTGEPSDEAKEVTEQAF